MNLQVTNATLLGEAEVCTIEALAEVSGLSLDDIEVLVVSGAIWPADAATQPRRLRDDFELDSNGVALAMTLLRRVKVLERALAAHPRIDASL
jgi:chaperone modulatory protein CbpM